MLVGRGLLRCLWFLGEDWGIEKKGTLTRVEGRYGLELEEGLRSL
jgi:hypothetical protein